MLAAGVAACHDVEPYETSAAGCFDQLWTIIDEHYCFFDSNDAAANWRAIGDDYRRRVSPDMTSEELFEVCAAMLDELRDGHVNLAAPFATSYYRAWWADYPQNYDARIIEQYYFNFNYRSLGALTYGLLPENVGYIYYPSFSSGIGDGNLDQILAYLSTATALIIDVRDNGGGSLTNVETLVARFITEPITAGYIRHKTGPAHDDFSPWRTFTYNPAAEGRIRWAKPVVVLTNRSTFSAANNFVGIMASLPNVTIIGDTTGGGCGMPFSSELSNGWSVRLSACPILDPAGNLTEFGIEPDIHVYLDAQEALQGRDTMLDGAVQLLTQSAN